MIGNTACVYSDAYYCLCTGELCRRFVFLLRRCRRVVLRWWCSTKRRRDDSSEILARRTVFVYYHRRAFYRFGTHVCSRQARALPKNELISIFGNAEFSLSKISFKLAFVGGGDRKGKYLALPRKYNIFNGRNLTTVLLLFEGIFQETPVFQPLFRVPTHAVNAQKKDQRTIK